MQLKDIFKISARYILRYKRRYVFLFAALVFGFCIVTVIISLKDGMSQAVYDAAQGHYAGDIVFAGKHYGYGFSAHIDSATADTIIDTVKSSDIDLQNIVLRTLYISDGFLHFNGNPLEIKYLVGVDWETEKPYFDSLNWTDKSDTHKFSGNSIVISTPIASALGAREGDSVIVEIENRSGQKDTTVLIVDGIISDSSIFGYYKAFVDRRMLNNIIGMGENDCSTIGLYIAKKDKTEKIRSILQKDLEGKIPLLPLIYNRDQWSDAEKSFNDGLKVIIITLQVYLSEVSQMLQALNLISYFLYFMMLLIIMVSASVTYRLILRERIKEIATLRAIGAKENDVRGILICESLILSSAAVVGGFLLSLAVLYLMSFISFSWMPSFEIFLKDGRLNAVFHLQALLKNISAIYIVVMAAVYFPALNASRAPLARILSGGSKE
jgi:ABC-type lipoprotein release transport system permease subunit